jgi:hypothetical protein
MKKILYKTVNIISCIIFSLLTYHVHGQIVYTDVVPDTTVAASGTYDLDINNDNVIDFVFKDSSRTVVAPLCAGTRTDHYLFVTPVDSLIEWIAVDTSYFADNPVALNFDSLVNNPIFIWDSTNLQVIYKVSFICEQYKSAHIWGTRNTGNWSSIVESYLGVRFAVGPNLYYGWIHVGLMSGTLNIVVKDYAYNSTPSADIYAGQQSPEHISINNITASPYCVGDTISVGYTVLGFTDTSNVFTVQLSDSTGSFSTPVNIGSLHSISSGIINGVIPAGTVKSYSYLVRIISSSSSAISSPNIDNLIIFNSLPDRGISGNGMPLICPGTTYSMWVTNSDFGYTMQWNFNGVAILNDTNSYSDQGNAGIYTCDITNVCGTVFSDSIILALSPLPPAIINVTSSLWICPGQVVLFQANTGLNFYYQWNRNSVAISSANQPSYLAAQAGRYSISITDSIGCQNTSPADTVNIGNPSSTILPGGPTTVCVGDTVMLYRTSGADTSFIYQWYQNGIAIVSATTDTYAAIQTGAFTLHVTNPSGNCSTTSAAINVTVGCVGIAGIPDPIHFSLVQNAATLVINASGETVNRKASVEIIDNQGRVIYSCSIISSSTAIDKNVFSNGIYFLKWLEADYSEVKAFTITH